ARLFQELQARNRELAEALERQTVTGEILRVIARSPTEVQPVLDTLTAHAARLLQTDFFNLWLGDQQRLRLVAPHGGLPRSVPVGAERAVARDSHFGRAVLESRVIHVEDIEAESEAEWGRLKDISRRRGGRTFLAAPLLREGRPIGAISTLRLEVQPFTEPQI